MGPFDKQYTNSTLLKNLYIIRYDVRGCGRSDAPLKQEAYSSKRQAEDFKAVMDAFNVKKPFVATWSLGGIVPADVLSKYGPDSLVGVILLGSFPHRNMHGDVHGNTLQVRSFLCFSKDQTALRWAATQPPAVRQFMLGRSQDETGIISVADRLPITSV
ncbi:hypothetical protein D9758_013784 [Tetrapyrgos nigripes]|uniref:AB hydrolase-1 domain-containing protein n=1 Tax=Tetrapyrgos nigripes TaxID=182062 RepID=A0A8H5FY86_9AGAR|nr:hypothetical protein D9758_013784 [Tetrapyrgos nigripes]